MTADPLLTKARALWEELARERVSFGPAGSVEVAVSPDSLMCPRRWAGVVALGGSAIVTAPDDEAADAVHASFSGLSVEAMVDADAVASALPVAEMLGPAWLSYLDPGEFRPVALSGLILDLVPADDPRLCELERAAGVEDAGEASIGEITSPAFAVRVEGSVVAAAGYRAWPHRTAHVSILTAPERRGEGLGRAAASAATAHALAQGLLPQWRARPAASRRVAAALGFRELGAQLSFRLG